MTITISLICFLLMVTIFMQFKITYETEVSSIETMKEEELETELVKLKDKLEENEKKYDELSETLKKYEDESFSKEEAKQNLEEELEKTNLILGKTDVEGSGIIIKIENPDNDTIDDSSFEAIEEVDFLELLRFIHLLREAGAEAISINDQRIVAQTYVVNIGDYIKVNSKRIYAPYEIKAIGNAEELRATLIDFVKKKRGNGQKIEITDNNKIIIKKYSGSIDTKFIETEK